MLIILILTWSSAAWSPACTLVPDETPWPPELRGARDGTVTLTSEVFLAVPEAVRVDAAKPGAAPFDVAKSPPTVELAFHRDLGPDAARDGFGRHGATSAWPATAGCMAASAITATTSAATLGASSIAGTRGARCWNRSWT
jgi:hypothetical protein